MSRDFPPILAKLLPLLSSPHDGEVVASARAIERILKSEKRDWHDIVRALPMLAPPPRGAREGAPPLWCYLDSEGRLQWLAALASEPGLNPWSREFAASIAVQVRAGGRLTPKQIACLDKILAAAWRVRRREAPGMSTLETALEYIARGWAPIPIPHKRKKPIGEEWPGWRITKADAPQPFIGGLQNVGVILGEASGGLADVDLDSIEAVRAGSYFLQRTLCFGRASKPRSHWLYQSELWQTEDRATIPFKFVIGTGKDRKEQMILELRIGGGGKGAQTVFPGSVHETGEPIAWGEKENVARAEGDDLMQRCARAAATALLAANSGMTPD
jgi:Bifunctional DNA primase/polymerase, N-terminal